ncbi:Iron-regulated ABC transporter permease protein SufD [Leptolyngbyaceae cyanobacterium JSC-12]|nr:Iron-regulated ABC transporter permease protein SufD [Leptolyngbyaceae cyanobacterium JSC-12]
MIEISTVADVGNLGVTTASDRTTYLKNLLALQSPLADNLDWLQEVRDRAASRVQELAIPSTREEEWRFTDLSPLLKVELKSVARKSSAISQAEIASFILPESSTCLVFVDGTFLPELSTTQNLPTNMVVGNLATAIQQESSLQNRILDYLARQPGSGETFTALNTASMTDVAVIYVPQKQIVDSPIHVLFVSTADQPQVMTTPRCLVIAESNSSLTLIEDYISLNASVYFTNSVTEVWVEANAHVNHTRIQRDSQTAFHIGKTAVSQARDAHYTCNAISLGAALSRHHLEVYQTGEQTYTMLNGLTMIADNQVADTHSLISYTKPYGTSNQIHKCIVDDQAHAVFNGKIFVPKAAQLTDARQLSKSLLMSPKARVDTKPQLEITADNVKCAHGATVSQLESDEVFYLQSRGIDENSARSLLVYAFAYDIISQIPVASLRNILAASVRIPT